MKSLYQLSLAAGCASLAFVLACSSSASSDAATPADDPQVGDGKLAPGGDGKTSAADGRAARAPGDPPIKDGAQCQLPGDCESNVCKGARCEAPTATDGVKNGEETDIDCGGAGAPHCASGNLCKVHSDCVSNGCSFEGRCASHPSCTKLEGGFTCGPNDSGARQQDCCDSAPVGNFVVDKFQVTAGRMRTFIERVDGNVRAWAAALPAATWNSAYTVELPDSAAKADEQLGPFYDKRSCQTGDFTGHTYWTTATAGDTKDFSKEVLDTKALNCVPWWLLSAFCVWDGGHLTTEAELRAAYTNGSTTSYPWGAAKGYSVLQPSDFAIQKMGYATPNPPAAARTRGGGFLDVSYYVAPPGRRALGYNATGHADMVGNLLEWVGDSSRQLIWKGSFESHAEEAAKDNRGSNDPYSARDSKGAPWRWGTNLGNRPTDGRGLGYYAIGGRCSRK